ncbi:unnamed protein product [Mytilus coruscus]|uniref:Peptidase A2 domain-containing protein n=1 Tax=Mytilus coruscus TaxID=42192 RepID=A0A6J8BX63_MYTCO|nr:unnamed protein product [Mytilus coruscus]
MPYSSRDIKTPPKNPVHRNERGHSPVKSFTRKQLTHDSNSDSCDSEDNDVIQKTMTLTVSPLVELPMLDQNQSLETELSCQLSLALKSGSRRKQLLPNETPEKFAADLKRLYDKAYKRRDARTRQEDLQRFLLGLYDYKARINIELNRDPLTIEEAVYEVVTYTETMKNPNSGEENHKRSVRQIKKAQENDSPNDQKNSKPSFTKLKGLHPNLTHESSDSKASGSAKLFKLEGVSSDGREVTHIAKATKIEGHNLFFKSTPNDSSRCSNITVCSDKLNDRETSKRDKTEYLKIDSSKEVQEAPGSSGVCPPVDTEVKDLPIQCSKSILISETCVDKEPLHESGHGPLTLSSISENDTGNFDIIGRQILRSEGVYIKGSIENTNVVFTADTGATRTVISTKVFKKIPRANRPELQKSNSLASANGQPLKELGKANFELKLCPLLLIKELIVAEIEDEALLGLDILMKVGQSDPIRKVTLTDIYVIPARSEVIVDVFIDRFDTDTKDNPTELLIEPHTQFTDRYPLRMASCLVDPSQTVTNKVRLLNPLNNEIEIVQNTVLGIAEEIEGSPIPLFNEEDSEENANFNSLWRIKFANSYTSLGDRATNTDVV